MKVSFLTLLLQAVDSRDSMAMALYSQCFNWIICTLNRRIKGKEDFKSISILDIFGFENFEVSAQCRKYTYRSCWVVSQSLACSVKCEYFHFYFDSS